MIRFSPFRPSAPTSGRKTQSQCQSRRPIRELDRLAALRPRFIPQLLLKKHLRPRLTALRVSSENLIGDRLAIGTLPRSEDLDETLGMLAREPRSSLERSRI